MSLLNEEQIKDVMAMFDCYASGRYKKSFEYDFGEWNKKQTTQQIEPDWSKASDNAVFAVVHVTWVNKFGTWLGSHPVLTFERPAPVITPHPHAELIAKFAEVAARRVDPWVEFEFEDHGVWIKCEFSMRFQTNLKYRYIGDKK